MGIEDRDYYRSGGGASGGGYLTTCPQCGRSLASTLWRMHAHNPQQAHCVEAGCRDLAVGYCAEAPFAGGLGPLCGEHLMRHRRQRHDVRFVDGGVCSECDGQGQVPLQGGGQGAGDGWLRCPQCSGLGYESEDVRERRRDRARQEEKESRRREENRRAAEEARRRSEESRRAAEERGRRQEAEGAWRGRTGYEGSAQCAACGGSGRVPTQYHQALDVPLGASSEEITRAFRRKAMEHHPDRNKAPDATRRMQEVSEAREMRIAYKSASVPLSGKMLRNRYEIDDDRFAIGFSTNRPENLQGFHSPNMMVVVTEAHGMRPAFEEALKRLNPSKVLLVGNALSTSGEFYESHRALRSRYKRVKISAYDTPAFTGEPIEIYGLMNEEDIADREADTGRDHPLFMAGVLAEFPDAQDDSLTGRKAVDAAMADDAPSGEGAPTAEEDERQPVYIGVDVARFGYDKSALIARRGQRVIAMKAFVGMDTMRLSWEASSMARELGADAVFVDETGVGGGVVDRLRELGAPVYGVQFGGRAPHPVQFGNLRSEIFWELRRLLEERLIALPNDDALAGQLLTLRYDVSSSGQVKLESKKAMRTKGLPSPDLADALAMAFMRPPSLQIWTGNEPFLRAARNGAGYGADGNGAGYGANGNGRAPDGNGVAHNDRHSREGGNPAPAPPADAPPPPDPADVPLDRFFIRF